MENYEVVVLGGGPGGYVAAIQAAKLGKRVALIEARELGGTCLNRGCIPSKTLLRHAEVIETIEQAKEWGIETGPVSFSLSKMIARKDAVIQQLRNGIAYLLKRGEIKVYEGFGEVRKDRTIAIRMEDKEELIKGDRLILATGSKPLIPPIPGIESAAYFTSDTIFDIEKIPESMVIVGGGIIGVELACIFASLQVRVHIVEMGSRIVPSEEPEASKALAKSLKKKGITVLTNTKVAHVEPQESSQFVKIEKENGAQEIIEAETILLAVGRAANTASFAALNLEMNGPFVKVDNQMASSAPGIYAIGDIVGGWQLAHVASAEGRVAAANAAGVSETIDYSIVPRCVYTSPEIASVGITEEEAKRRGIDYKLVRIDHRSNGRALAQGEKEGFTKLIAGTQYGEILGVLMVGTHVTEMIAEPSAFMHLEGTVDELASLIHAHPTISESLHEASISWLEKGVHH
ncbi:Dihydrolipoyl dehydrogenase [Planococcus massiliensis]|uniref:Dihydrolipoyl dehydrogenase n=1 Tax=Planococcus massiliensis TaxID=1499687 RepID=A0A098EL68_9BACL|nr:dihydrolipoyl dehydrogenase [Planococcus massiliensis]CEG22552.1 Dihydrolipoyl dehydrogenase [Planococcus massiliensis]